MTKQEFEAISGITYTNGEFHETVNPMYMAAGQLDKNKFCIEFKHHKDYLMNSRIVSALVSEVESLRETVANLEDQIHAGERVQAGLSEKMVDFLILQAEKWSATDIRDKAIEMVGIKEYIRRRMEMKLGLWEADMIALQEILK